MNKSFFVWIKVRVKVKHKVNLYIPIIIPIHILLGLISYLEDIASIAAPLGIGGVRISEATGGKIEGLEKGDMDAVLGLLRGLRKVVREIMDTPPFSMVDIDVETKNEKVQIKLALA